MSFPITLKLDRFHLVVKERIFEAFKKRMFEVGYKHQPQFNGRVHYFWEGVDISSEEVFLEIIKHTKIEGENFVDYYEFRDNFYDKRDNSPLFNIIEAMCEKYGGTLVGNYYQSASSYWGVKIENGKRDHKAGQTKHMVVERKERHESW